MTEKQKHKKQKEQNKNQKAIDRSPRDKQFLPERDGDNKYRSKAF